jgi:hypothetical protein
LGIPRITLKDGLLREFGIRSTDDIITAVYTESPVAAEEEDENYLHKLFREAAASIKPSSAVAFNDIARGQVNLIALLGDWHWGQESTEREMGEYGAYDTRIAEDRLRQYFDNLTDEICAATERYGSVNVYLVLLGDMLEGSLIRDTQSRVISSGVVVQMLEFFAELATYIARLCEDFEDLRLTIVGVPGNHTRLTKSRADVDPRETMDFAGYAYMQALLRRFKNIEFLISESWHSYSKISGIGFYFSHGDGVRAYQGLPAYGLIRMGHGVQSCMLIEDKQFAREHPEMLAEAIRFVDYVVVGHFHSGNFLEDIDVEVIVNGSPTGTSQFAAKDLRRASRPSQSLLYVDSNGVFAHRKIFLR